MNPSLALVVALRLVQTIPLPGVEGRIDHLAADVAGQRLFIAALGNNSVEVVDLKSGQRIHSLTGFREPQGVGWVSARLVVASGGDGACRLLNGLTLKPIATANDLADADNVRFDSAAKQIFVGYGDGALAILSGEGKRIGDIKLAGHPESFQLERTGKRIFVNVPAARHVAVVDREKRSVIATWALQHAESNFPMALDEANHRLFVGCRKPASVLVFDTESGNEIARIAIEGDTDDVFYDATGKRVYVSCGAGFIDVLDSGTVKVIEKVPTAAGARTSLFLPELNRLYLAVPHRGNQPAEVRIYEMDHP